MFWDTDTSNFMPQNNHVMIYWPR